jgi:serine/threonine protein kinase
MSRSLLEGPVDEITKNDWQRVRSVFEEVLLTDPEGRWLRVQELCGANQTLLNEVKSLLDSHEDSESYLDTPAVVRLVEDNQVPNQLVAGQQLLHYEIRKLIGKGGMGEVYLARDTRLDRNVALKLLRRDLLPHLLDNDRLLREARAAALLEHPNICNIYEISEADGFSFIVMQYVVGTTLDDIVTGGGIELETALDFALQIAAGLAEAHSQGLIHRDIKPANIIISRKGHAKILDFGLAKFIEADGRGSMEVRNRTEGASGAMGTVPYMSPEQLRGEHVDAGTDVFSFGTLLFEIFSGVPAFRRDNDGQTISAILNDEPDWALIPASLRPLLHKCLAKSRASRYASVVELARALEEIKNQDHSPKPKVIHTTGSNKLNVATDPNPIRSNPLRSRQTGHDAVVLDVAQSSGARFDLFDSQWLIPATLVGAFLVLLGIGSVIAPWWQESKFPESSSGSSRNPSAPTATANQLITIPGGIFTMGRAKGKDNEKPEHQELVKPFRIFRTEVTNGQFAEFMTATSYRPSSTNQFLSDWLGGRPVDGQENMPVRFVNIGDINAYVKWLSQRDGTRYRLPTEQEWEFAARNGAEGTLYPWGDTFDAKCVAADGVPPQPVAVGSRPCTNKWGVADLVGNVFEWTSSAPSIYPDRRGYVKDYIKLPETEAMYMVRGGSVFESTGAFATTSTFRVATVATKRDQSLGFRLVTIP